MGKHEQHIEATDKTTVETYNRGAEAYEQKYQKMGPRVGDIERGFVFLLDRANPFVFEIGVGNGREAKEICKQTDRYFGIDVSSSMLGLAQRNNPYLHFEQGDVVTHTFPSEIDIIFAFASLLHIDKNAMKHVLEKADAALTVGGVFYISLKRREEYSSELTEDTYGERQFFYYNRDTLESLMPASFETVYYAEQDHAGDTWLTIAFRKRQ